MSLWRRVVSLVVLERERPAVGERDQSRAVCVPRGRRIPWNLRYGLLPCARWSSFIVTPATLLRWHRAPGRGAMDLRASGANDPFCARAV